MKKKVLLLFSDYHFPTDNGKRIMLKGFYEFFEKEEVDYFIIGSEKEITSNEIKVTNLPKANFLEKIYNLFVYSLILRKKSFQEAIMFNKRAKDILDNIDYSKYDVVLIDTVRISQYISDKNIVSNMYLYLDDLYSRRYEKMIEVKGEYKDIDINPLGNFKSKLPKLAQKFLKNKIIEKIVLKFEKALIYNSEIRESKRFHNVLLINFDEANHLSKLVDKPIQDIKPRIIHQEKGLKRKLDSNSSFLFLGSLNIAHNKVSIEEFLERNLHEIKAEIPEFHIKIVGKNPSDKLKELQRQNSESVTITGFVEDLEIEIANSKAMIVPLLFGTGVKLKTLDAFRCSTPVIGTNYAFEGIAIDDRIRKYRYDTEYELIDKIKKMNDFKSNLKNSKHVSEFYMENYSIESVDKQYNRIFWNDTK